MGKYFLQLCEEVACTVLLYIYKKPIYNKVGAFPLLNGRVIGQKGVLKVDKLAQTERGVRGGREGRGRAKSPIWHPPNYRAPASQTEKRKLFDHILEDVRLFSKQPLFTCQISGNQFILPFSSRPSVKCHFSIGILSVVQ